MNKTIFLTKIKSYIETELEAMKWTMTDKTQAKEQISEYILGVINTLRILDSDLFVDVPIVELYNIAETYIERRWE